MALSAVAEDLTKTFEQFQTGVEWRRKQLQNLLKVLQDNQASVRYLSLIFSSDKRYSVLSIQSVPLLPELVLH